MASKYTYFPLAFSVLVQIFSFVPLCKYLFQKVSNLWITELLAVIPFWRCWSHQVCLMISDGDDLTMYILRFCLVFLYQRPHKINEWLRSQSIVSCSIRRIVIFMSLLMMYCDLQYWWNYRISFRSSQVFQISSWRTWSKLWGKNIVMWVYNNYWIETRRSISWCGKFLRENSSGI